jgi:hypothetical protein
MSFHFNKKKKTKFLKLKKKITFLSLKSLIFRGGALNHMASHFVKKKKENVPISVHVEANDTHHEPQQ